jgi:hypothetical protein
MGVSLLAGFSASSVTEKALAQGNTCDERAVPSRLQGGATARVIFNGDGIGVVFRDGPGKEQSGTTIIRALPEGEILNLVAGPICVEANIWWQVSLSNGESGWVSEGDVTSYFIEPYTISSWLVVPDSNNPRVLNRWRVDANGNAQSRDSFVISTPEAVPASQIWQEPDLIAANVALQDRLTNCPGVLQGTSWQGVNDASVVMVPPGQFDYYLSPDGGKLFVIQHRVVRMPGCNSAGRNFGISYVQVVTTQNTTTLFPYGQHSGARSKTACLSPDVTQSMWRTSLSEVVWSPDSDTVAFVARYIDEDKGGRPCAYYFTFMVDVFSGAVTPIAEGRHVGWGEGGTRLYYFTQETDTGYNILHERFWQLSNGETTQITLPDGASPLPRTLDSTNVYLPWSEDGRQVLMCADANLCSRVFGYDVVRRVPSPAITVPDAFPLFQVNAVYLVAGNARLLWLTTDGRAYIQGLQGVDAENYSEIQLDHLGTASSVVHVIPMPGGIYALLQLNNGEFGLLNTVNREVQALGVLGQSAPPADDNTEEAPAS